MNLLCILTFILGVISVDCKNRKGHIKKKREGAALAIPKGKYKLGIFSSYKPTICGVAQFTENMIKGLKKNDPGIEIEVFNICKYNPQKPRKIQGVQVRDVFCTYETEKSEFKKLAEYVKKRKFDGVIVNHEYYLIASFKHFEDLVKDLKTTQAKVYTYLHTPVSYPPPDKKEHIRKIAAISDSVIVMSWKAKHYLHHSYGIPKKKIVYFPHGIKTAKIDKKILKYLEIPKDKFIVYTDGIMHEQKGIERMVHALQSLKQKNALGNILVLVAGLSSSGTQYMEKIQKMINDKKLGKHFKWIKKFLSNEEMATLHRRADVYFTLFEEVIPTSGTLTYAMYSGDAIISTPYRYALELLGADHDRKKGTNREALKTLIQEKPKVAHAGIAVPFRNTGGFLASAILKYKNNPKFRKLLKVRSKRRVKGYSWKNVSNYIAYYLKTGKNIYINKDPYKNTYIPSQCIWSKEIKTFFTEINRSEIKNKNYLVYKDNFVRIEAKVNKGMIRKIRVEGKKKDKNPISIVKGRIEVFPTNHIVVTQKKKRECTIRTPNIIFRLRFIRKTKAVEMKVLFENIHGSATGVIGSSLRQKYDLTKPGAPSTEHFILSKNAARIA